MDLTIIGVSVAFLMVIIGLCSYVLGKRKTQAPVKAGLMGFVFSVIPVLGIIYLVYLFSKDDINEVK